MKTALSSLALSLMGESYTLPRPDSSLIMDNFIHGAFEYIRTPSAYYEKPVYKNLWKRISKNLYECTLSAYRTKINQTQAKGLLKYTQLEFDL